MTLSSNNTCRQINNLTKTRTQKNPFQSEVGEKKSLRAGEMQRTHKTVYMLVAKKMSYLHSLSLHYHTGIE